MRASFIVALGGWLVALTWSGANAAKPVLNHNQSIYTELQHCTDLGRNGLPTENELADLQWLRCNGPVGYTLDVENADSREYITIRSPTGQTFRDGFDSDFNHLGPRIEWRHSNTAQTSPHALIARFFLDRADRKTGTSRRIVYLTVIKITASSICRVALVPASAKDNLRARTLADRAPSLPCIAAAAP